MFGGGSLPSYRVVVPSNGSPSLKCKTIQSQFDMPALRKSWFCLHNIQPHSHVMASSYIA